MTDLDKLEELERAATKARLFECYCKAFAADGNDDGTIVFEVPRVAGDTPTTQGLHDLRFLIALRNNAPAMIAELRKLRAEVEGLRAALELSARTLTNSTIGYAATEQELMNVRAQLATAREDFVVVCPCCGESYSAKTTKGGGA